MNKIFSKIFMWMFIGLLTTFATSFIVFSNPNMLYNIFSTKLYYFIWIAEIIVVIFLSARIHKMSTMTAIISFLLYSVLNGLTFSSIFVVFKLSSIISIFLVSALLFLLFAFIGHITKLDLTKFGTYLFMALLGLLVLSIVNIFIYNKTLDLITCSIGLLIFIFYIAYDIQKIKSMIGYFENENNLAIIGAFELYLDFINVFIRLLSIFGKRND